MIGIIRERRSLRSANTIALEEAEFYRALPRDRLARIRPLLIEKRFDRGRLLMVAGEPAAYLWTLRTGEIRLFKSSPGGRTATLEILGPGEIFGAVSALDELTYPVSVEGVSNGSAWCLPRKTFLQLLAEEPGLGVEILKVVSQRLQDAHERVRSLAHDAAPSRLAQALLRAASEGEARVTRRALAETAGTTVETAIRVLRGFERDEIIQSEVGHVSVLDESALRRIAKAAVS
jgi:CRP-like cAMP-binding protein